MSVNITNPGLFFTEAQNIRGLSYELQLSNCLLLRHRQRDTKPAALAFACRLRPDAPFVVFGNLAAERQADAGAFIGIA